LFYGLFWWSNGRFQLAGNQALVGTGCHKCGAGAHGLWRGFFVAEALGAGHNAGQQCRGNLVVHGLFV
jgi:hypothetical protein